MKVGSRSRGAEVGFSPGGGEVASMIPALLSVGLNVVVNKSPPDGLASREFCTMTSSTAGVDVGVPILFARFTNNGLPKMAVIRVLAAHPTP